MKSRLLFLKRLGSCRFWRNLKNDQQDVIQVHISEINVLGYLPRVAMLKVQITILEMIMLLLLLTVSTTIELRLWVACKKLFTRSNIFVQKHTRMLMFGVTQWGHNLDLAIYLTNPVNWWYILHLNFLTLWQNLFRHCILFWKYNRARRYISMARKIDQTLKIHKLERKWSQKSDT